MVLGELCFDGGSVQSHWMEDHRTGSSASEGTSAPIDNCSKAESNRQIARAHRAKLEGQPQVRLPPGTSSRTRCATVMRAVLHVQLLSPESSRLPWSNVVRDCY